MATAQPLPPLTLCPKCGNAERTTACRFCGISKIKPYQPAVIDVPMVIDPSFESSEGAVKVGFRATLNDQALRVVAVIAPPEPDVGILQPYPIEVCAIDERDRGVVLSYPEARYLVSHVAGQLF